MTAWMRFKHGSVIPYRASSCSCSVPKRDHFLCNHVFNVSSLRNIEETRLVLASITTFAWMSQYPEGVDVFVPRRDELLLEDESMRDTSLALPAPLPN